MSQVKLLEFDSNLFGRRIGMLQASPTSELVILDPQTLHDYDLVQCKASSSDTALVHYLESLNFNFVEGEIDFELDATGKQDTRHFAASASDHFHRVAEEADIPTISAVAAPALRRQTRFRAPWFSEREADAMYTAWIMNAVYGKFDDVCLVVENNEGNILGFVTLRAMNERDVRIGLISVKESARRAGLGGYLIQTAKEWTVKQGRTHLKAATQVRNLDAMRLYTKTGWVPIKSSYWFYKTRSTSWNLDSF